MFWTCSQKGWRVKHEVFPKSFGDLWAMFWHHPWRLRASKKNKKVSLRSSRITWEVICANNWIQSFVLALIYVFLCFIFFYIFPLHRAPKGALKVRLGSRAHSFPFIRSFKGHFERTLKGFFKEMLQMRFKGTFKRKLSWGNRWEVAGGTLVQHGVYRVLIHCIRTL